MKRTLFILLLSYLGSLALARAEVPGSFDLTCRSQAKEVAVQTYQSCVTTARKERVDEIRKEYQAKLNELKAHYDGELKKLAPGNAKGTKALASVKGKKSSKSSETAKAGVTTALPEKKISSRTLPVQNVTESNNQNESDVQVSESARSEDNIQVIDVDSQAQDE